jgi:hypothetical protein
MRAAAAAAIVAATCQTWLLAQSPGRPVFIRPTAATIAPMLDAYGRGDHAAVSKWASSVLRWSRLEIQDLEAVFDRSPLSSRVKAAFVLELAAGATFLPETMFNKGRTLLVQRGPLGANRGDDEFEVLWHHAALGVMQGRVQFAAEDRYLDEIGPRFEDARRREIDLPTRFPLARAVAAAGLCCWDPGEQYLTARGSSFQFNPPRHTLSIEAALVRFEEAARIEELRAEALIRGGVLLAEAGRERKAVEWFERVPPHDDTVLGYVQHVIHGRMLDKLARTADAVAAYRRALDSLPGAQTARIGLAAALLRLGHADEAVAIAAAARQPGASEVGRLTFHLADARFLPQWLSEIRRRAR